MYNNKIVQNDLELILNQKINFEKLKNKAVLITGATGMLASYYMYTLMYLNDKLNYNIKIYPLARSKEKLSKLIDLNRSDIFPLIQDVTKKINLEDNIDYIVHMASSSNPSTITTNPVGIIEANVIGTFNVLDLAKEKNAKVLFTSTREVYGKMDNADIIKEEDSGIIDQTELRSCYPESKRLAENLIISYAYQYNIKYQIVRIAHSYGPGMIIRNDGRIMADLICNVVDNKNIVLKSSGEAKRAFCYVADAITALFFITVSDNYNEIYNIANETEEISIKDLAILLADLYELNVEFNIQENNNQYVKFKRVKLDTSKLENLGWKPIVNLKNGVSNTVKYFKD